jgi:hypothetical protein
MKTREQKTREKEGERERERMFLGGLSEASKRKRNEARN